MPDLKRTGLTVAAITGIGAVFAAGVAVGAGPARVTPIGGQVTTAPLQLANADLRSAASCDELLEWYVDRGVDRVTPYGWDFPVFRAYDAAGSAVEAPAPTAAEAAPAPSPISPSGTGTNVQEAGVDEADVVKTDGRLLVRVLHESTLEVYDVSGPAPVRLGSMSLPGIDDPELLLSGDRVVVVGSDPDKAAHEIDDWFSTVSEPGARVVVVDISDPASPTVTSESTYDASLVAARQHGDVIRLVLSTGLPDLDFVQPGVLRSEDSALRRNREIVRQSTLQDWLTEVTTVDAEGTHTTPLLGCDDVAIPADDSGLGTTAVVGFTASAPSATAADVTGVATDSTTVYVSADHLYLASSPSPWGWEGCCWSLPVPEGPAQPDWPELPAPASQQPTQVPPVDEGKTTLYAFDLAGTATTYAASGRVDGIVADRWSMDEHDGVLRVAVGPSSQTGDFNSVVTLDREGATLVEIGRVDKLGVGEQIKSVRWFDDLAVMVTFRQTDPFYAIDLTDPAAPRLLGVLKVPGFSSYLHPLGSHRMIGLGSAADDATGIVTGAKASLLDVSDVTAPRELDTVTYTRGSVAMAGTDPRQFTWLPDQRTALTVISRQGSAAGGTGFVSVLRVDHSTLTNRMVEVEYGDDVARVRLVPLPDGRVVLVTGDAVSFFAV